MGKTKDILNNLPDFLKSEDDSNNYKFITSFDPDFQDVSDNIVNLKSTIQISSATGTELDDIGVLFQLYRGDGESDVDFRNRIITFWQGFAQGGTRESILTTLKSMTGLTDDDITYTELDTLIIKITANIGSFNVSTDVVIDTLNLIKAAGIHLILNFQSSLIDTYEHTDNINIGLSLVTYIIPDLFIPDSVSIPL